jgi:hypothetical protein
MNATEDAARAALKLWLQRHPEVSRRDRDLMGHGFLRGFLLAHEGAKAVRVDRDPCPECGRYGTLWAPEGRDVRECAVCGAQHAGELSEAVEGVP